MIEPFCADIESVTNIDLSYVRQEDIDFDQSSSQIKLSGNVQHAKK